MPSVLESASPEPFHAGTHLVFATNGETEAELRQASWPQVLPFGVQLICSWHQVLENGDPREEFLWVQEGVEGLPEAEDSNSLSYEAPAWASGP